jgi:hypothetical protein
MSAAEIGAKRAGRSMRPQSHRKMVVVARCAAASGRARQHCVGIEARFVSARERGADHPGQINLAIWLGEQEHACAVSAARGF